MVSKIKIKELNIDNTLKKAENELLKELEDFDIKSKFIMDLEKQRKGKIKSIDDVKKYSLTLYNWLNSIVRGNNNVNNNMIIVERINHNKDKVINIIFYTFNNSYSITAIKPSKKNNGYLGCILNKRKPDVGEWWTRGNDLADGDFNENTWNLIISNIIASEVLPLEIDYNIHEK